MKLFLFLVLFLSSFHVQAQNARNPEEALHFIKLGNTLRMIDRPQQAIDLLLRAMPAVQTKDSYLEAMACETLGYAYNDQENKQEAIRYFQKARFLYKTLKYGASEAAMQQLTQELSGKELCAGIDIGASGVKLAIFGTSSEDGFYSKTVKAKPLAPNITLVSGTEKAFQAAQTVMKTYVDSIQKYKIPADRVYIAFSSGVNETLGKTPNKKKELYKLIASVTTNNLPGGDSLRIDSSLTAAREAELFMIGSVPRKLWPTTSCIDIGSGNTKGGYYGDNRRFHPVSLGLGTKTLTNLIDKNGSLSLDAYKSEAQRIVRAIADSALTDVFAMANAGLHQRRTVALGGGITWAMAVYLHPEKAGMTAVPLTVDDARRFARLALTDYHALTHPNLSDLSGTSIRKKAETDLANVQNQFNEKQIIAGALLLETIFRGYNSANLPKRVVFIRDSDISWVTAKFLEKLNQNYERAIARGAQ